MALGWICFYIDNPFCFHFMWQVVENLEGISLKKCINLSTLSQIGSKGFPNLRLVDLTEASPTIVENFIQGRNLNNVKWLCLKKCMIQKLPSNLFHYLQLQVLDLAQCLCITNASFHSLLHHKQFCVFVNVCVWSTFIIRIMDILFQISSHGVLSCVVHHHFFLGSFPFALHMMGLLCLKVFPFIDPLIVLSFAMPQLPNFS